MLRDAVLMLFLQRNPDIAQERGYGPYVLYQACRSRFPPADDVFRLLLELYPGATLTAYDEGELPIHRLLYHYEEPKLTTVQLLVRKFPLSLEIPDQDGCLPLHVACGWGCNVELVRFLLQEFPAAARETDRRNRLPIHYAIIFESEGSVEMVRMLVDTFPEGLIVQDDDGSCPLHEACCYRKWEIAEVALTADAVSIQDSYGHLPIHDACRKDAPFHLVQRMVELHPDSLQVQTASLGYLPLHFACDPYGNCGYIRVPSLNTIRLLVDRYPLAPLTRGHTAGKTPLQLAFDRSTDETKTFLLDQQQRLVQAHRDAVEFVMDKLLGNGLERYHGLVEHIWQLAQPDVWWPPVDEED